MQPLCEADSAFAGGHVALVLAAWRTNANRPAVTILPLSAFGAGWKNNDVLFAHGSAFMCLSIHFCAPGW